MTSFDNNDKLNIHSGIALQDTIRTSEYYVQKYMVDKIITDKGNFEATIDCFQMIDLFNYLTGNVKTGYEGCDHLLKEYALINAMSIIEAILQEAIHKCYLNCRNRIKDGTCKVCDSCRHYFAEGKDYELRFKKAVDALRKHHLIDDRDCKVLVHCYDLRNEVHVRQEHSGWRSLNDKIFKIHYQSAVDYIKND